MKKVIVLPMDGYINSQKLLTVLEEILQASEVRELLAFVKLNDGLHNSDAGGPKIKLAVEELLEKYQANAGVFIDLKIFDVSETMKNVLKKYQMNDHDILTVSSNCSAKGILELRRLLPNIQLAMISALTDMSVDECQVRFGMSPEVKIFNDLMNIKREYAKIHQPEDKEEPFDLVVCSYHELDFLNKNLPTGYGYIVPGIRDQWMRKKEEHQKRTIGVSEALEAGATYVVMGAQMTKGNPELGISPTESRQKTIEIIQKFNRM